MRLIPAKPTKALPNNQAAAGTGTSDNNDTNANILVSSLGTDVDEDMCVELIIYNMATTTEFTTVRGHGMGRDASGNVMIFDFGGRCLAGKEANDGIKFLPGAGTITTGVFRLFGRRD